jgi:hypothetical protein
MTTFATVTSIFLALSLGGDAILSLRPPKFIVNCLSGVNFPRNWWWVLIVIKASATAGLVIGLIRDEPAITATVSAGVLAYFLCAIVAHIRARFLKSEFWVNCLGMTALAVVTLIATLLSL